MSNMSSDSNMPIPFVTVPSRKRGRGEQSIDWPNKREPPIDYRVDGDEVRPFGKVDPRRDTTKTFEYASGTAHNNHAFNAPIETTEPFLRSQATVPGRPIAQPSRLISGRPAPSVSSPDFYIPSINEAVAGQHAAPAVTASDSTATASFDTRISPSAKSFTTDHNHAITHEIPNMYQAGPIDQRVLLRGGHQSQANLRPAGKAPQPHGESNATRGHASSVPSSHPPLHPNALIDRRNVEGTPVHSSPKVRQGMQVPAARSHAFTGHSVPRAVDNTLIGDTVVRQSQFSGADSMQNSVATTSPPQAPTALQHGSQVSRVITTGSQPINNPNLFQYLTPDTARNLAQQKGTLIASLPPFSSDQIDAQTKQKMHRYAAAIRRSRNDLRISTIPGISMRLHLDCDQRVEALQPPDVLLLRQFRSTDPRYYAYLDFVILGLFMKEAKPDSIIRLAAWEVIKEMTALHLMREKAFYNLYSPLQGDSQNRQAEWRRILNEQCWNRRWGSQETGWEIVQVQPTAGAKRIDPPGGEGDIMNAQKKVRDHGHFTPGREQPAQPTQLSLLDQMITKTQAQMPSFMNVSSKNLIFFQPHQLEQGRPEGYPSPPNPDLSGLVNFKGELQQGPAQRAAAPGAVPASSLDVGQHRPHGYTSSMSPIKAAIIQKRPQKKTTPGSTSKPQSPIASYSQGEVVDLTQPTPMTEGAQSSHVPPNGDRGMYTFQRKRQEVKQKNTRVLLCNPEEDPWAIKDGRPAWKKRYPMDAEGMIDTIFPEPPFTALEDYTPNSIGKYKCFHENLKCVGHGCKHPCCQDAEHDGGLEPEDMQKAMKKALRSWRVQMERLIYQKNIDPRHKTWEGDYLPKKAMSEEDTDKEQLRRQEQQAAEANLTANQPIAPGGIYGLTAGSRSQQVSSAQPNVEPAANAAQPPKPQHDAAKVYENTARLRQLYIEERDQPDLEYFDAWFAARDALTLGQILTHEQQIWRRQNHPRKIPDKSLDEFWVQVFPGSAKGREVLTRRATQEAQRKAEEQAAKEAKQKKERDQVLKNVPDTAKEIVDDGVDALLDDPDELDGLFNDP